MRTMEMRSSDGREPVDRRSPLEPRNSKSDSINAVGEPPTLRST